MLSTAAPQFHGRKMATRASMYLFHQWRLYSFIVANGRVAARTQAWPRGEMRQWRSIKACNGGRRRGSTRYGRRNRACFTDTGDVGVIIRPSYIKRLAIMSSCAARRVCDGRRVSATPLALLGRRESALDQMPA